MRIRTLETRRLTSAHVAALADLFAVAWSGDDAFTDEDRDHAMGGTHFIMEKHDEIVAHAAVVARQIESGGLELATGYVEAVATQPRHEGKGYGTAVLRMASEFILENFEFGALSTGKPDFYRRLGWQTWQGPTFVRTGAGLERTPEEDGFVMVLLTPRSPDLDIFAPISCEWRSGDAW